GTGRWAARADEQPEPRRAPCRDGAGEQPRFHLGSAHAPDRARLGAAADGEAAPGRGLGARPIPHLARAVPALAHARHPHAALPPAARGPSAGRPSRLRGMNAEPLGNLAEADGAGAPHRHLGRGFNWLGGATIIAKAIDFSTIVAVLLFLTKEQVGVASLVV